MLTHGFVPNEMLSSTIIPIPKGKNKSINMSENYRGIALSSIIGKVFDRVLLTNHWSVLKSSDMQFGFKPGHSTSKCTFVINEVTQYYLNNNSSVYICMLDATKAFDRVEYCKLFKLMLDKGICPLIARFLSVLYTNQSINVKWGNCTSQPVTVNNGVKQGGILSPILFAIYIDELFLQLNNSGYGCYIGNLFSGCFGYADDATLLAPSISALKLMLNIVDNYGTKFNVKFNPDKCQLVSFNPSNEKQIDGINYKDVYIRNSEHAIHIGNLIGPNLHDKDIYDVTNKFITAVNYVLCMFSKCQSIVKHKLFLSYCMPLYGSVLWDISSEKINYFYTQWRKSVRRIWNLPYTTHNNLLNHVCNEECIDVQIHKRFVVFFLSLLKTENKYVKCCVNMALNGSRSKLCNSLNYIAYKYKINKEQISKNVVCSVYREDDIMKAGNIIDLCHIRDTRSTEFSTIEINYMLNYLCTD